MKKAPTKPAKPPKAQVVATEATATLPAILASAELPTAQEQELAGVDLRRFHRINVRAHGQHFRIWDWDDCCGDRLIKGSGGNPKAPLRFPLKGTKIPVKPWEPKWITYSTLEDALAAANLLQAYLDEEENPTLARLRAKQKK